jgi:hypothetical protein
MAPSSINPTPTGKQLIYGQLLNIELLNNIPYAEVVDRINGNISRSNGDYGGFIRYDKLIQEAKKDPPFPKKNSAPGSGNPAGFERNDGHQALISAAAEAIVYKALKSELTIFNTPASITIHDPVAQGASAFNGLPPPFKNLAQEALKSFKNKTPDLLVIAPTQRGIIGDRQVEVYPTWSNQVDLDNSKNLTLHRGKEDWSNKIVVSPVEITTTGNPQRIKDKIKKFEKYGSDYFKNNPNVKYVPVLELDYAQYMSLTDSNKKIICRAMKKVGGIITLHQSLLALSKSIAKEAIESFTPLIRAYEGLPDRQIDLLGQVPLRPKPSIQLNLLDGELFAKSKELESKDTKGQKLTTGGFFEKSREWFNNIKQSFALNNKPQATTNTTPKRRLASEVYQEMAVSLKATASYPQKAGIDIVNNSNHLDLMLATQLMKKDIDHEKILRQSPNYRSKEPTEANLWLKNIIEDGISMNKEYYLDSTVSQKIIRSYDNEKTRPPEKSNFEKLSESAQRYNSEYSSDREGLLIAVATAAIKAGMNPEKVLRQSPDYLLAISGKGEALVEKTIEKAESAVQAERSRVEQRAQEKDNQRDRGYER